MPGVPKESHDHAIFELHPRGDKKVIGVTQPHDVLSIPNQKELEAQLEHYAKPFLKQLFEEPHQRLFYLQKIRPALRYYCKKFDVTVPDWLKTDKIYTDLEPAEKLDMFGTVHLPVREFSKIKSPEAL